MREFAARPQGGFGRDFAMWHAYGETSVDISRVKMTRKLALTAKIVASAVALVFLTFLGVRIYDTQRGLPLEPWHTFVPKELSAAKLDAADWKQYAAHEAAIFDELRREVTQKLPPHDRVPVNRYFDGSPVYPGRFQQDFNRSFILEPDGKPVGAVVLLHGLTDSPYSQRHIARFYRERGFVAVVPRLPAHGTVPAALTDVEWELWVAATRLAVREARRRTDAAAPLHLVGFSNGGALALIHALDSLGDPKLHRPDRLILLSPMVGITSFARFAGIAALPAYLPAFAKAAWLGVVPEFNPFKYNSFPVNGATQTHRLTRVLQERIARYGREGKLKELPPTLTFQSVMDFTVSTRAILSALYAHLPANGSELVLFDINRSAKFGPLLRSSADTALTRILPGGPQAYRTTIITNRDDAHGDVVERVIEANGAGERSQPVGLAYPDGLYSLSHVAIPFPISDALYGMMPDKSEDFGLSLGTLAPRGERNVLIASLDALLRASSNPFFPYVLQRIGESIPGTASTAAKP
jgi:alpha-beta hydrolase superfamily lysophospholipase